MVSYGLYGPQSKLWVIPTERYVKRAAVTHLASELFHRTVSEEHH